MENLHLLKFSAEDFQYHVHCYKFLLVPVKFFSFCFKYNRQIDMSEVYLKIILEYKKDK